MAYDFGKAKIVLFGGKNATTYLGDTWIWDSGWKEQTISTSPSARASAAFAAYGGASSGVGILFGGISDAGHLSDTWKFS